MRHAQTVGIAALALALVAPPALAGKKDKGKKDKPDAVVEIDVSLRFSKKHREDVRGYFAGKHGRGKCPPGLAKKRNGCLPPGQAKKRYAVGHSLPPGLVLEPLPRELEVRLGKAPAGYRYGILDGDLVKLAVGTALVVDAIDGLVN